MGEERRDVLDGLGGYTPGPWEAVLGSRSGGQRYTTVRRKGELPPGARWRVAGIGTGRIRDDEDTANARLIARAPELVEEVKRLRTLARELYGALEAVMERVKQEGEGPTERYERAAADFHRATGMIAPGKSAPLEMEALRDREAEREAWEEWCQPYRDARATLHRAREAGIGGEDG